MSIQIMSPFHFHRARAIDGGGFCHAKRQNGKLVPAYNERYKQVHGFQCYQEGKILAEVQLGNELFYIDPNGKRVKEKGTHYVFKPAVANPAFRN